MRAIVFLSVFLIPVSAFAYIGPGSGLSGLGALLALLATLAAAILGFIWYPIKRAFRFLRKRLLGK